MLAGRERIEGIEELGRDGACIYDWEMRCAITVCAVMGRRIFLRLDR